MLPLSLAAQQPVKSKYNLFRPTPKTEMRDMDTDRPDVTESPFTVDAGHFQLETDLMKFEKEKSESTLTKTTLLNQLNVKIGLTNSTSVQVNLPSYGIQRETDVESGERSKSEGIGDLTLRVKQNLTGNDHGNFAIAVLPFLKFPTSKLDDESRYEGGIIIPFQIKLPHDWKLGMELEGSRLKDNEGRQMHNEFLQSLTVSHELLKHLQGIAETYYSYDLKKHHWSNFLNAAMQLDILDNLKLDAGLNYGIQYDASNTYFIGASFRM